MQLQEAVSLIQTEQIKHVSREIWADLGCGSGLFTQALSNLLAAGSTIYAIDKNISSFKKKSAQDTTIIKPMELDFISDPLELRDLDGILMANALHFVKDKKSFLEKMKAYFRNGSVFIIVEYDMDKSNPWVPYPISYLNLKNLFISAGFNSVIKIQEIPSRYNKSNIYSVIIK